ncbi:MAG: hypothetical protein ACW9WZ_03605 [Nitrosopumilus sp.]
MSEKVWLGQIFLKDEGGYEIVIKSLTHYKKRLQTMGGSPELKDSAAMFGSILVAQAKKNIPEVEKTVAKINDCLNEKSPMSSLLEDLPLIEKSLMCFESDYQKAMETKNDYFINLIGNLDSAKIEIEKIPHALNKLKSFSE